MPPWTTLVRKRVKSPLVIRPRKEAPKGSLEILGPDVNLVGIGSETPSHYLRTGRTADMLKLTTRNPSVIKPHDLAIVTNL